MAGESLRIVAGRATGTEIWIEDELLIGRATTGEARLGDDPELSRRHAVITRRAGDQLTIEDLGSSNGTFVNERRVTRPQPLRPGDKIKLGTTTLQVLDAAGAAPRATAVAAARRPEEQPTSPREEPPRPVRPTAPSPTSQEAPSPAPADKEPGRGSGADAGHRPLRHR